MDRVNRVLKFPKLNASLFQLLLPKLLFPLSSCLKDESFFQPRSLSYKLISEYSTISETRYVQGVNEVTLSPKYRSRWPQGSPGPLPYIRNQGAFELKSSLVSDLKSNNDVDGYENVTQKGNSSCFQINRAPPSRSFRQMLANFSGVEF